MGREREEPNSNSQHFKSNASALRDRRVQRDGEDLPHELQDRVREVAPDAHDGQVDPEGADDGEERLPLRDPGDA